MSWDPLPQKVSAPAGTGGAVACRSSAASSDTCDKWRGVLEFLLELRRSGALGANCRVLNTAIYDVNTLLRRRGV